MKAAGYICPFCISHLDIEDQILLTAKNHLGQRGVISLSTTLGDYTVKHHNSFKLETGKSLELSCPVCSKELSHDKDQNFSKLIRVDEKGDEHTVLFSNTFGNKCTFHLKGEKATSYGEHALRFQDPEWFLQEGEKE